MEKYSLGVDISCRSFHVCLSSLASDGRIKIKSSTSLPNNEEGFKKLTVWIEKYVEKGPPFSIVMEATGVYYERCALHLFKAGYRVSVVLPNVAKKYLESLGQKTKNDKIDAKGLSRMGAERVLEAWQPMDDFFYTLRSYTRQHEGLQATRTILRNQKHALENSIHLNALVEKQLDELISTIEEQLKELVKAIEKHLRCSNEVWKKVEGICRIKGLAVLSVAVVLGETNGFALFKNIPQVVSYAGYDVIEDQSGKRVGKTRISKHGNGHIRRILYMPAIHAATWQGSVFEKLYNRIVLRTGIKMKAYVAVQKKLLIMIYTLWKKEEAFEKEHSDIKHTEEQEQVLPSLGSDEVAENDIKKVVPAVPELHKVNIPTEPSQYAPSLVKQI